jgi:hypothetical protein
VRQRSPASRSARWVGEPGEGNENPEGVSRVHGNQPAEGNDHYAQRQRGDAPASAPCCVHSPLTLRRGNTHLHSSPLAAAISEDQCSKSVLAPNATWHAACAASSSHHHPPVPQPLPHAGREVARKPQPRAPAAGATRRSSRGPTCSPRLHLGLHSGSPTSIFDQSISEASRRNCSNNRFARSKSAALTRTVMARPNKKSSGAHRKAATSNMIPQENRLTGLNTTSRTAPPRQVNGTDSSSSSTQPRW